MIQAKCIQKFRNKSNQIIGYRLQDSQGKTKDLTPQQLKDAIHTNQIHVLNLTLTSDNRLVDTKHNNTPLQKNQTSVKNTASEKTQTVQKIQYALLTREIIEQINKPKALKFKSNQNLNSMIPKVKKLGYTAQQISEDFLLVESDTEVLLVSNKQIQLDNTQSSKGLFKKTEFTSISFHNTDTSNVTNMNYMFDNCKAQSLDLSSFDTSNVTTMTRMFYECQAQSIDISSFNTFNVKYMDEMFAYCKAQYLDLSRFNTSNVIYMNGMFSECKAQSIDLSNFNTSNVKRMENMLNGCKAQIKTTDQSILSCMQQS